MSVEPQPQQPPISVQRVEYCIESATFWSSGLPQHANRLQTKADAWSIFAGLLSALTGLAAWTILNNSEETAAQVAVSAAALLSALSALMPRIRNYAETAGQARELGSAYGTILGSLVDVRAALNGVGLEDPVARRVVNEFEKIKAGKDRLRSLPKRPDL